MPELKVVAGYDGSAVDKGLNKLQTELAETAAAANKLDSALGKNLAKGSNTAAQSLTNLGRIAQDAPFGFIGIQNNINPLLESFQRLKVETGSTGKAFKALAGSLLGGAGIGLAVSLATGALTLLAQNGFFKAKKAADEGAKANKEFAESLRNVEQQGIATGAKLQGYVNIARDQTLSIEQRNEALKAANKIFGEHGEKLTLLNVSTAAVTEQINKFTQATIQQALASKFAERAADLIIQQRDASKNYGEEVKKLTVLQERFNKVFEANTGASEGNAARLQQAARAVEDQTKNVQKAAGAYRSITGDVKDISGQLQGAQLQATLLFAQLGTKAKDGVKKAKAEVKKLKDDFLDIKFDPGPLVLAPELKIDLPTSLLKGSFEKDLDALAASVSKGVNELFANPVAIQEAEAKTFLAGIGITKGLQDGLQVGIDGLRFPELIALAKDMQTKIAAMTSLLQEAVLSTVSVIGESIGAALAGGGNFIQQALGGVFSIMGDFLIQLGKAAILTSKLFLAIEASKSNPFTGIIGGLAAIAAGAILKNIKLPAFATGGTFQGGGTFLAGERGPELITAPRGTVITPNAQTNAILGQQQSGGTVVFEIEGRKLVGILQNTNDYLGRNGQL